MSTTITKRVQAITSYKTRDGGGEKKPGLPRGQTGLHPWLSPYMLGRGHVQVRALKEWQQPTSVPMNGWQYRVHGSHAGFNPRLQPSTASSSAPPAPPTAAAPSS